MAIEKILIVEQDGKIRGSLAAALQAEYEVEWISNARDARQRASSESFDLILAAATAPEFDALFESSSACAWPPVIVLATAAERQTAVDSLSRGASCYVLEPFSKDEINAVIAKAAAQSRLTEACHHASGEEEDTLLGDSFACSQLRSLLAKIAQTTIPVLIRGQRGVGKELLARLVHRQGPRAYGPFIKVDCAAVAEDKLQQQLFGWSAWGPIGQGKRPQGALELAAAGTILIDEISILPSKVQAQLLKAIQEKTFQRTDGTRSLPLDARIIATSSRDLEAEVQNGAFNEQLFFALNVVPIWVPPLKERPQDVRALANSFLRYFARKHGAAVKSISTEALAALEHNEWQGNVRQLRSAIEQGVLHCQNGVITPDIVVVDGPRAATTALNGDIENLDEIEKRHILSVLSKCNGNRTSAAKRLGISIRTIRNKLKLYRTQASAELLQEAV